MRTGKDVAKREEAAQQRALVTSAAGIAASSGDGGGRRRQEGQLGFGAATAVVLVGALVGRRYRFSKRPT